MRLQHAMFSSPLQSRLRTLLYSLPGYFGNDCALSLGGADGKTPVVLSDRGYTPRAVGPRVYIYDLPPELTTW